MSPDDIGSGSGGAPPAAAPAPAAAPPPAAAAPAPAPVSAGGTGGTGGVNPAAAALAAARGTPAPVAPGAAAGQPPLGTPPANAGAGGDGGFLSIRDAARQYGYDLGNVPDDHSALQQLILRARQSEQMSQMAQIGQQFVPHMAAFQQWQQQQRQQQQQAQQQAAQWHKAPEFDPSWVSMVVRDPATGDVRPAPGAPPDIVQKLTEARRFQQNFQERFAQDPIATIKPGLEGMIREVAQQLVQEQIGQYRDTSFGESFIRDNASWLHSQNPQGGAATDAFGNPVLSPAGQYFRQQLQAAVQLGIRNEKDRANYAMGQVRMALMQQQQQQQTAQQQAGAAGAAQQQQLLQQQQQFVPGAQQTPPNAAAGQAGAVPPKTPKLGLADRMRGRLQAAGVTDRAVNGNGRPA